MDTRPVTRLDLLMTLSRTSRWPASFRKRLLGLVAALVATVAITPGSADAAPKRPDCDSGQICMFDDVRWNDFTVATWSVRPVPGRRYSFAVGLSFVNTVSSYANYSMQTYCAYDATGRDALLWQMRPGGSSSWVGRKKVGGRSVNDRADYISPCLTKQPGGSQLP
jgi:hypothetical protein